MSEVYLLTEVRDAIRDHADYRPEHCEIEYTEMAPAIAPDLFIMVIPGEQQVGEVQDQLAVTDIIYSFDIVVALRMTAVARDRRGRTASLLPTGGPPAVWAALAKSFELHQNNIATQIDASYSLMTAVNSAMVTAQYATGTCDVFITPPYFQGAGRIREAPGVIFDGTPGETVAALVRTLRYGGARRLIDRSI